MAVYVRTKEWLTTSVEDELLMMHTQNGTFQGLNETGAFLWELLDSPQDHETLLGKLLAEFNVPVEQAHSDVETFLTEMTTRGMLRKQAGA